jgi:hypothetical protein
VGLDEVDDEPAQFDQGLVAHIVVEEQVAVVVSVVISVISFRFSTCAR